MFTEEDEKKFFGVCSSDEINKQIKRIINKNKIHENDDYLILNNDFLLDQEVLTVKQKFTRFMRRFLIAYDSKWKNVFDTIVILLIGFSCMSNAF